MSEKSSSVAGWRNIKQKVTDLNREVQDKQKEVWTDSGTRLRALSAKVAATEIAGRVRPQAGRTDPLFDEAVDVSSQLIEEFQQNVSMRGNRMNGRKLDRASSGRSLVAWGCSDPWLPIIKVADDGSATGHRAQRRRETRLRGTKSYSTRQKIIDSDDQELKDWKRNLRDANLLSEDARKENKSISGRKLRRTSARIQDFNRSAGKSSDRMVAEYAQKIQAAASAVAQKEGFTAVIDRGSESTVKIVVYGHPSVDLTEQIIKEFDRQNK